MGLKPIVLSLLISEANTASAGEDYAEAVREMTSDMAHDNHIRDLEKGTGAAG